MEAAIDDLRRCFLSFRGALIIDKNRNRTIADLAALSGTKAKRQGDGWILTR